MRQPLVFFRACGAYSLLLPKPQLRPPIKISPDLTLNVAVDLMDEATVWARAIYPLLLLAEHGRIQVWSEVALKAKYANFELEGIVDGLLEHTASGLISTPYLIVVEAKHGVEASYRCKKSDDIYKNMLISALIPASQKVVSLRPKG